MKVVFVIGAPGTGKTTMCERLGRHFAWGHISVGQLIREQKDNPETSKEVLDALTGDTLLSADMTVRLLLDRLRLMRPAHSKFLIDGFPINMENWNFWLDQAETRDIQVLAVLHLMCMPTEAKRRILGRAREHDNEDNIAKRMLLYATKTSQVGAALASMYPYHILHTDGEQEPVLEHMKEVFREYEPGGQQG